MNRISIIEPHRPSCYQALVRNWNTHVWKIFLNKKNLQQTKLYIFKITRRQYINTPSQWNKSSVKNAGVLNMESREFRRFVGELQGVC
jgi:hypothetical protein